MHAAPIPQARAEPGMHVLQPGSVETSVHDELVRSLHQSEETEEQRLEDRMNPLFEVVEKGTQLGRTARDTTSANADHSVGTSI